MITTAGKTMQEALKNKDYETLAQLYVEWAERVGHHTRLDLAETVKTLEEFTPAHYQALLNILEGK